MREVRYGRARCRVAAVALTIGAALAWPVAARAAGPIATGLPECSGSVADAARGPATSDRAEAQLSDVVDAHGTLVGDVLTLADTGTTIALGPSAFAAPAQGNLVVVGERRARSTVMRIVDAARACTYARVRVRDLVFGVALDADRASLYYSLIESRTRAELGLWRVALSRGTLPVRVFASPVGPQSGTLERTVSLAMAEGRLRSTWCVRGACTEASWDPASGRVEARSMPAATPGAPVVAVDIDAADPKPVPENGANRWPLNSTAKYAWHPDDTPPSWMRPALTAAADDATSSKRSQAPSFKYDAGARGLFRYTSAFPAGDCSTGIACASHDIPSWWTIRLRPNGYDFRWGTLHWCQADDRDGCFDVERTALHELGHIDGLDHWDEAGLRLHATDSVMNSIIPARGEAGNLQHAFGPCDTARLQERYDVVSPSQPISMCNDVDTTLVLSASADLVGRGVAVTFVAQLSISDLDAFGRLGGNPLSGREVQLRRRPASGGSWSTFWMSSGPGAGTYSITLQPTATYDYQAVFPRPANEGLEGSSSSVITVGATGMCGVPPCPEAAPSR